MEKKGQRTAYAVRVVKNKLIQTKKLIPFLREQYFLDKMVGPIGYSKELRRFQIEFLKGRGLLPYHTLLDIGCGPLQGGLAFIDYLHAGNYAGIDLRPESLNAAHIQIAKANLSAKNPLLQVSYSFGRDELGNRTFDFIWASQILYHLDCGELSLCLEQVASRLCPEGVFYGNVIFTPDNDGHWSTWEGFSFHAHSLEFVREAAGQHGLSMRFIGRMEDFGYPDIEDLKLYFMLEFARTGSSRCAQWDPLEEFA